MARLLQGLASSDATITQRIIMCRYTEIYGSYNEYLPLPQVVIVLEYLGHQNMRA